MYCVRGSHGRASDSEQEVVMNALGMVSAARIAVAAAALVLFAGCASSGSAQVARRDVAPGSDTAYISAVEQIAKRRGVRVVWMNPPEKRAKPLVTDRE
jgi:hypothetical protein